MQQVMNMQQEKYTPQEFLNKTMKFFFTLQITNKLYHLNTKSFARHKAVDAFDTAILDHIDKFAEVFIGRYNVRPSVSSIRVDQTVLTDTDIIKLFEQAREYLYSHFEQIKDTELLNIRDEIVADINKTLYLFTLH